jgi:hypothetical protein
MSDIFDCLDKSIQMIESFDPSIEIYIRKGDSIIPDIYLLKEEDGEEIVKHQVMYDIDYIVDYINSTPSHTKISKHLFSDIKVWKNKIEILFENTVEDEFLKNFSFMWSGEVISDCKISKSNNKIIIDLNQNLF